MVVGEGEKFPWSAGHGVVSFDRVNVLFGDVGDAAEDVDEALTEAAGGVVMTAFIQILNIEPQIEVDVVLLTLLLSVVDLFARAGADNELVAESTNRVAVAGESQLAAGQKFEGARVELHRFEHGVANDVEVTATDQEDLVFGCLTHLEVMRERIWRLRHLLF